MNNYIFPFLWMRGEPEEVLREEIAKIYECGIRAVCLEARPHNDFCGPGWWHDVDIVMDEAKKRDMKIWILDDKHFPTGYAAGMIETKYPEREKWYLGDSICDVFGGQRPVTIPAARMMKPAIGYWQIGEFLNPEKIGKRFGNQIYAVIATEFSEGDVMKEKPIDLTDLVKDGMVNVTLPEGQWRVHVLYKTQCDGGNEHYINMLDKVSAATQIEGVYESHFKRYGDEFGKTIAGFFSDEPEIGNTMTVDYEAKLGKKGMLLPWSDQLEVMLKERYGDMTTSMLPYLFFDSAEKKLLPQARYDFMDCVSKLYEENFSKPIGDWCRAHGVEYIGHVVEDNHTHSRLGHGPAHYFRAMTGQDMAGIDIIGSQVIFGAPNQTRKNMGSLDINGEFYHYGLGKMGASAGHLDPKKKGRTMCELFGAYGWNFGVRDMRWLLDHALTRGINHLVPHAFSMADYPDIDCPPHFYARGNNGQFPWFAELMKYANRMCDLLNGGKHVASVAILYDGEADWVGDYLPMEKVARKLMENQIEFDVVPLDILNDLSAWEGSLSDGKMIINGVTFDALLVPCSQYVPEKLVRFVENSKGLPVIFVGGYPQTVLGEGEQAAAVSSDWTNKTEMVDLSELAAFLKAKGMEKISIEPAADRISVYHYHKDRDIIMIMNEDPNRSYHGKIRLATTEPYVFYNGWTDACENAAAVVEGGHTDIFLNLEAGESCVLMEQKGILSEKNHVAFIDQIRNSEKAIDLSTNWTLSMAKPKEYPAFGETKEMPELIPVSDFAPAFHGIMKYEKTFELDQVPEKACLRCEQVFEVMRVTINGQDCGFKLTPPYQLEVGQALNAGTNTIVIEVCNTPDRDQANYPAAPFDFKFEPTEPSGMFGKVTLYTK